MRGISTLVEMLALSVALFSIAFAAHSTQPTERLIKDIPLQSFFHSARPWRLKIYERTSAPSDIPDGARLMQVCFSLSPTVDQSSPQCHAYKAYESDIATLSMLRGPDGKADRPAVVIRNTWSLGGGTIWSLRKELTVWTHPVRDSQFWLVFHSIMEYYDIQEYLSSGPLAGSFVEMGQVDEGDEPNMAAPRHYSITVYEPSKIGYIEVINFLSKKRYPRPWPVKDPVVSLTPEIVRALKAVYPNGVYASAVQR